MWRRRKEGEDADWKIVIVGVRSLKSLLRCNASLLNKTLVWRRKTFNGLDLRSSRCTGKVLLEAGPPARSLRSCGDLKRPVIVTDRARQDRSLGMDEVEAGLVWTGRVENCPVLSP
jgi:hypothetical protein